MKMSFYLVRVVRQSGENKGFAISQTWILIYLTMANNPEFPFSSVQTKKLYLTGLS